MDYQTKLYCYGTDLSGAGDLKKLAIISAKSGVALLAPPAICACGNGGENQNTKSYKNQKTGFANQLYKVYKEYYYIITVSD